MSYLYQGLAGSKFTTGCSPRIYEKREAAIRKISNGRQAGSLVVSSYIATNKTPSSVLNVARSYVRDNPPEELPVPGSGSGVLKEFLENIPFQNTSN